MAILTSNDANHEKCIRSNAQKNINSWNEHFWNEIKKPGAMHFECRNAFLTINFVKVMQANRKQALVVLRTHSALQTETLSTHFFHNFFLLPWYSVNWNELSASSRSRTYTYKARFNGSLEILRDLDFFPLLQYFCCCEIISLQFAHFCNQMN